MFLPVAILTDFVNALNPNARTHMDALRSLAAVKTEMMKIVKSAIEYGASGQSPEKPLIDLASAAAAVQSVQQEQQADLMEMEDEDIQLDTSNPPMPPPMEGEEGAPPPGAPRAPVDTVDENEDEVMTDVVAIGAVGIGQLVRFAKDVSETALMSLGERYVEVSKLHAKAAADQAKVKADADEANAARAHELKTAAAEQAKAKAKEQAVADEANAVRAHELKMAESERAHTINKQRQFADMMKSAPAHLQSAMWAQEFPTAPALVVPAAQPIAPVAPVASGSNVDEVKMDDEDCSDGDGDYVYNGSDDSGDEQAPRVQQRARQKRVMRPRRGCAKVTARDLCEEDGIDPRAHAFDMPADVHNAMRLGGLLARAFGDRHGRRPERTIYRSGHRVCHFSRKEAGQLMRCENIRRFIDGAKATASCE